MARTSDTETARDPVYLARGKKVPNILPYSPWLRVWGIKLAPGQAIKAGCHMDTKLAEMTAIGTN
jgi:hypothetical protein